ncbi:MAG: sulfotransferase [Nanoarchaeota archaeon]
MKIFLLRRILKYSAFFTKPLDKKLNQKYAKNKCDLPIIFIIGAPRTGSTLLYQIISSLFKVTYLNNLVYSGREIPFLSYLLSHRIYAQKGHYSFSSVYGNTMKSGLNAPSEAGNLWRRWMPKDKFYINESDVDQQSQQSFSNFVSAIINYSGLPLLIKNLYFSQRLRFLKSTNLKPKFIYIKREPLYTAQSIFMARQEKLSDINSWWSVEPYNYHDLKKLDVYNQIASQVYYIEKQIENDLRLFNENDILVINYEDLSYKTEEIIENIKSFSGLNYRHNFSRKQSFNIQTRNKKKIDDFHFQHLKKALKNF